MTPPNELLIFLPERKSIVIVKFLKWFFGISPESTTPSVPRPSREDVKHAVDDQLQRYWGQVSAWSFDSDEVLDRKQLGLDQLKAWANKTTDSDVQEAQLAWIRVAQRTINEQRKENVQQRRSDAIRHTLPPPPL